MLSLSLGFLTLPEYCDKKQTRSRHSVQVILITSKRYVEYFYLGGKVTAIIFTEDIRQTCRLVAPGYLAD